MITKGIIEKKFTENMRSRKINVRVFFFKSFEKIREFTLPKFISKSGKFLKILRPEITLNIKKNTILFEKISKRDE